MNLLPRVSDPGAPVEDMYRSRSVINLEVRAPIDRRFCAHEDPSVAAHSALQITRFGAPWLEEIQRHANAPSKRYLF
jgi:hypothetical protein